MREHADEIIRKAHEILTAKKMRISVAESCTGGLLSHFLTMLPGSSNFFDAGITTYSNYSKEHILGISKELIARHGVVSAEIAKQMAEKVKALANTRLSIATTGNLGPDVLELKERGLVYIAVSGEKGTITRELRLSGGRDQNKEEAAIKALELLLEVIGIS